MRIFEITDKNKTILTISGIDESSIDSEYHKLVTLLNVLIRLNSPSRNQRVLPNINEFESQVIKVLQNKLLDRTDPDIVISMNKLKKCCLILLS